MGRPVSTKEFKRGNPVSCVNAMGRRPYYKSRMEVSHCTFGFGAIIRRDLHTLLLQIPPLNFLGFNVLSLYGKARAKLNAVQMQQGQCIW